MKVFARSILQPSHLLAFIFGYCPYRKNDDGAYHRSKLGSFLQIINVVGTAIMQVHIILYYLTTAITTRHECSTLKNCSLLIIQTSNTTLALWLAIHRFVWASKTLRCLRLAHELNEGIRRTSSSKHYPVAFYSAIFWTIVYTSRFELSTTVNFVAIELLVTKCLVLYCETLVLEFINVICIALDSINQTLRTWQTTGNYGINDLRRLQLLYLKAASLAEVVDDFFGISWLVSFLIGNLQIILAFNWALKSFDEFIVSNNRDTRVEDSLTFAYLIARLASGMFRCFQICHILNKPSVKRFRTISILREMIIKAGSMEKSIKMNEFSLQVALRKFEFSAGGFFDLNVSYFKEIVGTWFTLVVILFQTTNA